MKAKKLWKIFYLLHRMAHIFANTNICSNTKRIKFVLPPPRCTYKCCLLFGGIFMSTEDNTSTVTQPYDRNHFGLNLFFILMITFLQNH